jgi:methionyl-tRNA formyltransferase
MLAGAPRSLRIAFAGTPAFAVPALNVLATSRHELVGVLTQPDRPAGRGRELTPSAVKQRTQQLGLPLDQPARLASDAQRATLLSWRPELLVVVAYGLLLPAHRCCRAGAAPRRSSVRSWPAM